MLVALMIAYVIGFNLVLLLFLIAALIFPRHGVGIFTVGVVLQGISILGNLKGTVSLDTIIAIVVSLALVIGGYCLTNYRKERY